jgi:hypothetical protein
LQRQHLSAIHLVVVAAQMQDAVNGRLDHVSGVRCANNHVTKLARTGDALGAVDRKRKNVGGAVSSAVRAVQFPDPLGADQLDGEVTFTDVGGPKGRANGVAELSRNVGEVDGTVAGRQLP